MIGAGLVRNFTQQISAVKASVLATLAAANGSTQVGDGTTTVADRLASINLADYAALRAYAGACKRVRITGYLVTAAPAGIAGDFVADDSDTTSADNGGAIIVTAAGQRWKRVFSGAVNWKWFGAKGDNASDDTAPINAALSAYPSARHLAPAGIYLVASPLLLQGQRIEGDGRGVTIIKQAAGWAGDAIIRANGRDNNNPNQYDNFSLHSLQVLATSGVIAVDLTGCRNSSLGQLYLQGPGPGIAGSVAIRLSDKNPAATSSKSCFFNDIRDVDASGTGWETFFYYEQLTGNCNNFVAENLNCYAKYGIWFGPNNGSGFAKFDQCYLFGGNLAGSKGTRGSAPYFTTLTNVGLDLFASNDTPVNGDLTLPMGTVAAKGLSFSSPLRPNPAGTTAAPIASGTGMAPALSTGAIIFSVPTGTKLAAGANRYSFFTNLPQQNTPELMIECQIVSGAPGVPVAVTAQYDYVAGGKPIYVDIVSGAAITLAHALEIKLQLVQGSGTAAATYNAPSPDPSNATWLGAAYQLGSATGPTWSSGAGAPNGVVTAPVGSLYCNTAGGASTTLYVKESGAGNTGWVAK